MSFLKALLFNFEGSNLLKRRYGGIAQLGEHLLCKQGVSGSIPLISTRKKSRGAEPGNNDCRGLSREVDKVNVTD